MPAGSQPIRVVHLLLTMDVGGLERVALDLVRMSDPRRLDARIVCLREAGALAGPAREMGVRVEALGARGLLDGAPRLVHRLRALRPHVLHTHNPGSHRVGVPARLLARVPHLVHTKHGRNHPGDPAAVARNRRLARFTSVVVAVSEDAARVARDVERIPAAKVRVIHNGVELGEPVDTAAWNAWTPRGITVARLDPVKDQTTLLRAARIAVEACPEFTLEIVGDGPERSRLETLTRDLGLEARVGFLGYRSDVGAILRRPQIFALSSVSEGISLTLLEAMAAGLPVVATDVGGNREVVESGLTGLLVPPSQPEALGAALVSLARDPHAARERGAAGRRRVEGQFDAAQTAARYEALYESLLARQVS